MRLATPLEPILDNLYFETFAFFVAYRTLWDNHERFHGAQDDPGASISFTIPLISHSSSTGTGLGTLWDYFGLPTLCIPDDVPVSALPFRAYNKIYDDWFRSATLQNSVDFDTDNGPDTAPNTTYPLLKRGKRFDYFTSCLPAPQRGNAVGLGITDPRIYTTGVANDLVQIGPLDQDYTNAHTLDTAGAAGSHLEIDIENVAVPNFFADMSENEASINDVRLAFATQQLLERDARSGTRYVESLKARWGVTSPDFRLQRAEYLGGGSTRVNISPVTQNTASTTPTSPAAQDKLGNLAGVGTANGTHSWSKSFVEHGVVIILGNLRGDITYCQGVDRYWSKTTRYDFVYPEMASIGEQAVLNSEIWITGTGTPATDDLVFGYTGRYDEHRYLSSKLTNVMRTASAGGVDTVGSLESWHLSEDFASLPALGDTFIQAETGIPLDRAIAIATEPHMIADFYHNIKAARPLPTFGVPGLTRL